MASAQNMLQKHVYEAAGCKQPHLGAAFEKNTACRKVTQGDALSPARAEKQK
jgi:hypothetical protein